MTSTALAMLPPLPAPLPSKSIPEWPAWATKLCDSLSIVTVRHDNGRCSNAPALPRELIPTQAQREELETHRAQIASVMLQTPINYEACAKRTFGLVAKLLLAKPARNAGPEAAEARMESYTIALDDVPTWAVEMAIRQWYRGECDHTDFVGGSSERYDYRWAPESADLRNIARRCEYEVRARVKEIDRILAAVAYVPKSAGRLLPAAPATKRPS